MIWLMYLRFIVPVLAVFYGTSLIADEVEDKTITYLFTRPIPRGAVMAGKYLAYLVCTIMVVLPSVMIVYFLIVPYGGGSIAASFPDLVKDLALLALGLIAYGALFAWVGARFKRPLLTGLIFVFGWEQAAMVFPGYLKRFTIAYYLQALVPHTMPSDNLLGMLQAIVRETPSLLSCLVWLGRHHRALPVAGDPSRREAGIRARAVVGAGRPRGRVPQADSSVLPRNFFMGRSV